MKFGQFKNHEFLVKSYKKYGGKTFLDPFLKNQN